MTLLIKLGWAKDKHRNDACERYKAEDFQGPLYALKITDDRDCGNNGDNGRRDEAESYAGHVKTI